MNVKEAIKTVAQIMSITSPDLTTKDCYGNYVISKFGKIRMI